MVDPDNHALRSPGSITQSVLRPQPQDTSWTVPGIGAVGLEMSFAGMLGPQVPPPPLPMHLHTTGPEPSGAQAQTSGVRSRDSVRASATALRFKLFSILSSQRGGSLMLFGPPPCGWNIQQTIAKVARPNMKYARTLGGRI